MSHEQRLVGARIDFHTSADILKLGSIPGVQDGGPEVCTGKGKQAVQPWEAHPSEKAQFEPQLTAQILHRFLLGVSESIMLPIMLPSLLFDLETWPKGTLCSRGDTRLCPRPFLSSTPADCLNRTSRLIPTGCLPIYQLVYLSVYLIDSLIQNEKMAVLEHFLNCTAHNGHK